MALNDGNNARAFDRFSYLLVLMRNLNFIQLFFISLVISYALQGIIHEGSAFSFIFSLDALPYSPWKYPVMVCFLYGAFLCLILIRTSNPLWFWSKLAAELLLVYWISYLVDFAYTGTILLLAAESLYYFPRSRWKLSLALFMCIVYLLFEFSALFFSIRMVGFEFYLSYFQRSQQLVFTAILNGMVALNIVLFMLYIVSIVQRQSNENERIVELNNQLNVRNLELSSAYHQLAEYSQELVTMTETKERNRLAREIHDTLGHALAGIITGLEACIALIDVAPDATKLQMKSIIEVAKQGVTDVRRSIHALRPDSLEKFDLESALINLIEEMKQATKATILYSFDTDLSIFTKDEEDVIYRIVQEAITNAIRHGQATEIRIKIHIMAGCLHIMIKDNGIGCAKIQKGFGLHHMTERLQMLGGSLSYHGEAGFVILARIPVRKHQ